jgi:NADPH2:quinone reductase
VLDKWGTVVSYNAFDGLPTQNMMEEMRKHLDVCPAVRCFSFHIYDHDREGRRKIMRRMIDHLADGSISPAIFGRFKLSEVRSAHELLESGKALGKSFMTRD